MKIRIGQKAPAFTLPDQNGTMHSLGELKGKWVLLYFYPKDNTPGCTMEACGIRDSFPAFQKVKAVVFGVSADTPESHQRFTAKYKLPFTLLSDEDHAVLDAYGVWGKKKFMGRSFMGISRTSFLIDPQGKIAKVYEGVKPAIHAEEVLKDLETLAK